MFVIQYIFQSSSNSTATFPYLILYIYYIVCYSIYFSIELKLGSSVNATSIWPLPLLHLISRYLHCRSSAHQRQIVWQYWRRRVLFKILQKNWMLKKSEKSESEKLRLPLLHLISRYLRCRTSKADCLTILENERVSFSKIKNESES